MASSREFSSEIQQNRWNKGNILYLNEMIATQQQQQKLEVNVCVRIYFVIQICWIEFVQWNESISLSITKQRKNKKHVNQESVFSRKVKQQSQDKTQDNRNNWRKRNQSEAKEIYFTEETEKWEKGQEVERSIVL